MQGGQAVNRFLKFFPVKITLRDALASYEADCAFQGCELLAQRENHDLTAILFQFVCVFNILWIIGQGDKVYGAGSGQEFDLVKGSDFIAFVGGVRNPVAEVENCFHARFLAMRGPIRRVMI